MATDSIFVADVMSEKLLAKFPYGADPPLNTFSTFPFDLMQEWWARSAGQSGAVPPIGSTGTSPNQIDPLVSFVLVTFYIDAEDLADSVQGRWAQYWDEVDLGDPIEAD